MTAKPLPLPPHIESLEPYASARSLLKGGDWVFLDANESPYVDPLPLPPLPAWNRYPDPTADALRASLARFYGVGTNQVVIANGSDELIDLAARVFVRPGRGILSVRPTYGMYKVSADTNGVPFQAVPLGEQLAFPEEDLFHGAGTADLLFLCSPNNPTGGVVEPALLRRIVERFPGVVAVDEAYGEFAQAQGLPSAIELVQEGAGNLLVLRTFSKAFGAAGLRLGYGIAAPEVIAVLLKAKLPYNVSALTQAIGLGLWERRPVMTENVRRLLAERTRLMTACVHLGCPVVPSVTNFFLMSLPARIGEAEVYARLRDRHQVVLRRVASDALRGEFLRVTVAAPPENDRFLSSLAAVLR